MALFGSRTRHDALGRHISNSNSHTAPVADLDPESPDSSSTANSAEEEEVPYSKHLASEDFDELARLADEFYTWFIEDADDGVGMNLTQPVRDDAGVWHVIANCYYLD